MPNALAVPYSFTAVATSEFGQGIDVISGNQCAYGAVVPSTRNQNRLNTAVTHTRIIASEDDYSSSYQAVMSVEGSTLTASFSAGASLLEQSQMSAKSFSLVIGTTVQAAIDIIIDPANVTLTDTAAGVLKSQGPEAFQSQYGTHFIGGFINGGEYFATINILFNSAADQRNFSASASGSISEGLASGKASAQFSAALSSFHSSYSLQSLVSQSGDIEHLNSADPDSLITACDNFSSTLKSDTTGGRRMVALGFPWSAIPKVRDILGQINRVCALDIGVSQDVATILRAEVATLGYLAQTAASIAANNTFQPVIGSLAAHYRDRINAAKQQIMTLSLSQVSGMSTATASSYCNSPTFKTAVDALSSGQVPVRWTYALDGAFNVPILNGSGVQAAGFSGDPHWNLNAPQWRPGRHGRLHLQYQRQ
jgi:hypothetical protein